MNIDMMSMLFDYLIKYAIYIDTNIDVVSMLLEYYV